MNNVKTVVVLSVLAVVLTAIVVVAASINPIIGGALGVAFTGIAAIIRAVRGGS